MRSSLKASSDGVDGTTVKTYLNMHAGGRLFSPVYYQKRCDQIAVHVLKIFLLEFFGDV